jgi:cell division septation protein DedD
LGVFAAEANARRVVDRARALGYSAESAAVGGAGKYRVRLGGFATRTDAQAAADSLGRGLGLKAVVLRR